MFFDDDVGAARLPNRVRVGIAERVYRQPSVASGTSALIDLDDLASSAEMLACLNNALWAWQPNSEMKVNGASSLSSPSSAAAVSSKTHGWSFFT
jgi:hypothetical protein